MVKWVTFREIKLGNKVNVHVRPVYRLGFEEFLCRECDDDFRHGERQVLELCLDPVLCAGAEWLGCFTGKNPHSNRGDELCMDKNGDVPVVLDLEAGYMVHRCVRATRLATRYIQWLTRHISKTTSFCGY